jgi:hypothetical protein
MARLNATAAILAVISTVLLFISNDARSAQPNEPADAQEQSKTKATVDEYENSFGFVPYHPDQQLSDKATSVQFLYDYSIATFWAEPCHFPHYDKYLSGRIFAKLTEAMDRLLPDSRDNSIAFNHLRRHEGPDLRSSDCATLKVRLEQLKAATHFPAD